MQPRYPIFIPTKGRWQRERRLTVRALEEMHIPYRIIVEQQEYERYRAVIAAENILILPRKYQEIYETCDDRGHTISLGSGPARNYIWDIAAAEKATYHWVIDDNIRDWMRLVHNTIQYATDGTIFRLMERFTEERNNVIMAGPNYKMFVCRKDRKRPFTPNTRIYSCILLKTDSPFRWRARYNEDTDLSLRVLKAGYATVLFNAFQQKKLATQRMRGGNTDELYRHGTLEKSRMIARLHPDVTRIVWRWGRWHHYVDYRPFRQNPLRIVKQ